jgi:small-conductance mechanosensitive channel/CRP-like cAMP-binding protein
MPQAELTQRIATLGLATPAIYLILLALGRWLRRRAKVRLGVMYHLFALCLAIFLPLRLLEPDNSFLMLLEALATMLGTLFLLALIRRFFWEYYFEEKQGTRVPRFMSEVVGLLIFIIALLFVLWFIYGIKIPGLLTGSGIAAVMLGLAMQDTLGNIIAGIAVHLEKPFQPGDWLIIENRQAEVIEVNWRSTRLRTNDNIYLDIPNNQITKQAIVNLSYPTRLHAMRLNVNLDYQVPPNEAKEALFRAVSKVESVLREPAPKVFLTNFGDSAILYEVKFWMEDHARYNETVDAIRTNIWYELQRQQIKIPFPIRTVHFEPASERPSPLTSARELLRRQPLFQCLEAPDVDVLLSRARPYRFGRGEKVIEQDAAGNSMFLLVQGEADVYVRNNGQMTRVAALRSGDCFGEMSLLTGEKRSATVVALTDCEVIEIDKLSLADVFQQQPEVMRRLSELLAKRQMENEGILANSPHGSTSQLQRRYETTFFTRLRSFFEL